MKIAILGTRGIPANYGGFETFAEELSTRLALRGHEITVYCRRGNSAWNQPYYRNVRLITLPAVRNKYLETVSHTFCSSLDAMRRGYDVCLFCNAANALFMIFPRIAGQKVAINVDGIERKRKKWNLAGRLWYLAGEKLSCLVSDEMISDAEVIFDYYLARYGKTSTCIPYGANALKVLSRDALERFDLRADDYFLYVSRLEPENNAHVVIEAFQRLRSDKKLVIVGSAPYSQRYIDYVKSIGDDRVVFTGYVFGDGYKELQSHAFSYIHATEVGGTHPALIEGMAMGNMVVANDTPENREVVGDGGMIYAFNDRDDLAAKMQRINDDPASREAFNQRAIARIMANYSWDSVVSRYEALFMKMAPSAAARTPAPSRG